METTDDRELVQSVISHRRQLSSSLPFTASIDNKLKELIPRYQTLNQNKTLFYRQRLNALEISSRLFITRPICR